MARDLNIRITADNADAQAKLGQTERAIGGVTTAANTADKAQKTHADSVGAAVLKYNLLERGVRLVTDTLMSGAKTAAEQASTYADLANKTGLSLQALQLYNVIAKESGTTVETYANAIFRLGTNLEGTNTAIHGEAGALAALGLSFDDLKNQRPEQQFEIIARALAETENAQERNRLGVILFGRTYGEIAKGVDMDVAKVREQITFSTDEQIKALDRMGDTFSRWGTQVSTLFQQQLGQMWIDLTSFTTNVPRAWKDMTAEVGRQLGLMKDDLLAVPRIFLSVAKLSAQYAQDLYTGVKTWLVDKFVGIVGSVKDGVSKVKGFFYDLYIDLVGRSIVPDMVDEIGQHIARLQGLMVDPVQRMTHQTGGLFQNLLSGITNKFSGWGESLGSFVSDKLGGILGKGLGAVTSGLMEKFSGLIGAGIGELVNMGAQLALKGLQWLGGKIKGLFGNSTKGSREDFASSLGFGSLSALYSHLQGMGPAGANLAHLGLNVVGRNDKAANERWMQDVQRFLGGQSFGGFQAPAFGSGSTGGPGGLTGGPVSEGGIIGAPVVVNLELNVSALDGQSVADWFRSGGAQETIAVITDAIAGQARYLQEA